MFDVNQFALLNRGHRIWNHWREKNDGVHPDFSQRDFCNRNLAGFDFRRVNFYRSSFNATNLSWSDFKDANLIDATFLKANLSKSNLSHCNISQANLSGANMTKTVINHSKLNNVNLSDADLTDAIIMNSDLKGAVLDNANIQNSIFMNCSFDNVKISNCLVNGVYVSGLNLKETRQSNLILTRSRDYSLVINTLQMAQIYDYLLDHPSQTNFDQELASTVLVIGNLMENRKRVWDIIRETLNYRHYQPVLFNSERPTKSSLAIFNAISRVSRFIIAELSDTEKIIPYLRNIEKPVQPIADVHLDVKDLQPYGLQILKPFHYTHVGALIEAFDKQIIGTAEAKLKQMSLNQIHQNMPKGKEAHYV